MTYQPKSLSAALIPHPILDDISVVIPTLGRPILEECFYWIAAGSTWPRRVIVVDQSPDSAAKGLIMKLRSKGVGAVHLPSSPRGRAAAVNRGLERVTTRFVAITDDDCFVERDWLRNLAARLRSHSRAVVSGRVFSAGPEEGGITVTSSEAAIYNRPRLKFDSMSGGNMGTSISVVEQVGLFDEDSCLRTAEDGEWIYRALRRGVSLVYAPEVVVSHYDWRSKNERVAQYRSYAHSQGGFYGKYLREGDWFIGVRAVIHLLRALKRWLRGILTSNEEQKMLGRAYLVGLLPGIITGMRTRQ